MEKVCVFFTLMPFDQNYRLMFLWTTFASFISTDTLQRNYKTDQKPIVLLHKINDQTKKIIIYVINLVISELLYHYKSYLIPS